MQHLDEGLLTALLDGELDGNEQRVIETHLRACAECAARLEELRSFRSEAAGLVEALVVPAAAPKAIPSPQRRQWTRTRYLAWAASIIVAMGLGVGGTTLFLDQTQSAKELAVSSEESPRPTEPQAAPPATASGPTNSVGSLDQAAEGERRTDSPSTGGAGAAASDMSALQADRSERPSETPPSRERLNEVQALGQLAAADSTVRPGNQEGVRSSGVRQDSAGRREADAKHFVEGEPSSAAGAPAKAAETGFAANRARSRATPPAPLAMRNEVSRRSQVAQYRQAPAVFQSVTMEEAVRYLSGAIRLIDGLTPESVEVSAADSTQPLVRVLYHVGPAESRLFLEQRRTVNSFMASDLQALEPSFDRSEAGNRLSWNDLHGFALTLIGPISPDSLFHFKTLVK